MGKKRLGRVGDLRDKTRANQRVARRVGGMSTKVTKVYMYISSTQSSQTLFAGYRRLVAY